jgi:lysophospholipase L1-like esterase
VKAKSFFRLGFGLCLAFATGLVLPANASAQVHLMPLGNSITDGDGSTNGGGYRYFLYNKMQDANIAVDFVGSLAGGSGFPDNDHEGHGGFRADQLAVQTYLTNNPPQAVLLEIGTNDVSANESATQIRDDIEAIIEQIHSFDANIEIYLGTVIPRKDGNTKQAVTDNLNALLPGPGQRQIHRRIQDLFGGSRGAFQSRSELANEFNG